MWRCASSLLEWCKLCPKADGSFAKGLRASPGNPLHGGGDDADAQECLRTGRRPIALVQRSNPEAQEAQNDPTTSGSMHVWVL